jgi:hypothetical protein
VRVQDESQSGRGLLDLAVYVVPPEDHALYQVCAAVLGWDCRNERPVARPQLSGIPADVLAEWVGPAAAYGPHGTIAGWMRVPARERQKIIDDLAGVARTFAPIRLERGRFAQPGDFWYAGTAPVPILVAQFDESLGALRALHAEVLLRFNTRAVSSIYNDRADLSFYNARHRWRIAHYHEARVLEDFEFHVSFATALPSSDAADRLRRAILEDTGLFQRREHTTWLTDELVLFERRPDGFWRLGETFRLMG